MPYRVKNVVRKEKLLVTSNFFFSHNVFHSYKSEIRQNVALCGNIEREREREREEKGKQSLSHYWRSHQTSSTVVSFRKGRLPQKLQSKSTFSCEIVRIHSMFCHGFIKKPKSKFNRNRI